jgi:hypothetical protein
MRASFIFKGASDAVKSMEASARHDADAEKVREFIRTTFGEGGDDVVAFRKIDEIVEASILETLKEKRSRKRWGRIQFLEALPFLQSASTLRA